MLHRIRGHVGQDALQQARVGGHLRQVRRQPQLDPRAGRSELVQHPGEDVLQADPGLLERVLANVTANAVQHSPPDRPPLVSASALGNRVEVRVVDQGPGVPEPEWQRIFVPFQRLGDRDSGMGVGLGLALARGLAEAMGGTLDPENTPGGGLTMVLSLPVATRSASTGDRRGPDPQERHGAGERGVDVSGVTG